MNEELVNVLLEIRHKVGLDMECWEHDAAKVALSDVLVMLDEHLTEHTKTKEK